MQLTVTEDSAAMSALAADRIIQTIRAKPDAALLVATGSSPLGAYEIVARRARAEGIETARLRIFQLDEYLNLAAGDRRLLYGWMHRAVLDPLAIPDANVVRLPSIVADEARARRDYEAAVAAAGGFDLAILGLGPNGHLGFNEPPSGPAAPTRVVELTPESITSNGPYWGGTDRVPPQALTAGMSVIRDTRAVLLLVSGEHKRSILERTIRGEVTPDCPSTWLQRHPNVTVFADRAAAGYLPSDN